MKKSKKIFYGLGDKVKLLDNTIGWITQIEFKYHPYQSFDDIYTHGVVTRYSKEYSIIVTIIPIKNNQVEEYKIPPSLIKEKIK